jgi:serine O-acetyltransferase
MDSAVNRRDRFLTSLIYARTRPVVGKVALWFLWLFGIDVPDKVVIGPGLQFVHCSRGLTMLDGTEIGSNVTFMHGVTLGRADIYARRDIPGTRIIIGDNATLCANATVLVHAGRTLTIGDNAVVGAGAVVSKNVPAGEIWAGNPARKIGMNITVQPTPSGLLPA